MSRIEELNQALYDLQAGCQDILTSALLTEDGLVIAGSFPDGVDGAHVAATTAAMISIAHKTSLDFDRGALRRSFVEWENGYMIMEVTPHGVLMSTARKEAKLGLILLDLSRAAQRVKKILS
jgi:predicted regulator of Ras-like GTPase activity (Roadblock/LC7/MglB family)